MALSSVNPPHPRIYNPPHLPLRRVVISALAKFVSKAIFVQVGTYCKSFLIVFGSLNSVYQYALTECVADKGKRVCVQLAKFLEETISVKWAYGQPI